MQERATKVSHGNTARQAGELGDEVLSKLCGAIASDESRHEVAYTRIVDELFRRGAASGPRGGRAGCGGARRANLPPLPPYAGWTQRAPCSASQT